MFYSIIHLISFHLPYLKGLPHIHLFIIGLSKFTPIFLRLVPLNAIVYLDRYDDFI